MAKTRLELARTMIEFVRLPHYFALVPPPRIWLRRLDALVDRLISARTLIGRDLGWAWRHRTV